MRIHRMAGLILCALVLTAVQIVAQAPSDISVIAWIAGDWQGAPGRAQSEEHWLAPAGGAMLGTSRTIAGGKMVFFEFLRIETRADGIYYVAQPKGRPGTDFKLTRASASEAVFENPAHDFPKRIIYRKNADGSLTARIEGDGSEKEKPREFHFKPINNK